MSPVCVSGFGAQHCIGVLVAGGTVAAAVVSVGIVLRLALSWLTGIAMTFALRHTLLSLVAMSGVGIHTFLPGGIPAFVVAGLEAVLRFVGLGGLV